MKSFDCSSNICSRQSFTDKSLQKRFPYLSRLQQKPYEQMAIHVRASSASCDFTAGQELPNWLFAVNHNVDRESNARPPMKCAHDVSIIWAWKMLTHSSSFSLADEIQLKRSRTTRLRPHKGHFHGSSHTQTKCTEKTWDRTTTESAVWWSLCERCKQRDRRVQRGISALIPPKGFYWMLERKSLVKLWAPLAFVHFSYFALCSYAFVFIATYLFTFIAIRRLWRGGDAQLIDVVLKVAQKRKQQETWICIFVHRNIARSVHDMSLLLLLLFSPINYLVDRLRLNKENVLETLPDNVKFPRK